MNEELIKEFYKLLEQKYEDYENQKNSQNLFRIHQIKNIIKILEKLKFVITSPKQLKQIKGIGKHTLNRIDEFLKYHKLREIKTKHEKNELENIIGIGHATAKEIETKYGITKIHQFC